MVLDHCSLFSQRICVGLCVSRYEVEEKLKKLKLEVETLSQSEQMAAKSQSDDNKRVT